MWKISFFSVPPALAAAALLGLGFYVWIKNARSTLHRALFYFCADIALWNLALAALSFVETPQAALEIARAGFVAIALLPLAGASFISALTKKISKKVLWSSAIFSLTLSALSTHPLVFSHAEKFFWGYFPSAELLFSAVLFYTLAVWIWGGMALLNALNEKKGVGDFLTYNQIKYVFLAWAGFFTLLLDFLPMYGVTLYPFSYLVNLYWCALLAVSILHYRTLPDVYFITRRLLIGSCFAGILIGIYGLAVSCNKILTQRWGFTSETDVFWIALALIVGSMLVPLYHRIKNFVDLKFFPEYHERKNNIIRLKDEMIRVGQAHAFNRMLLSNIYDIFRAIRASLFVLDEHSHSYQMVTATGWGVTILKQSLNSLEPSHPSIVRLSQGNLLSLTQIQKEFSIDASAKKTALWMLEMSAALAIPMILDQELLGFLLLGEKESGLPYSNEDMRALKSVAESAAFALERIYLSREKATLEIKERNLEAAHKRYLNPTLAQEILLKQEAVSKWHGERRQVTVLICDLRGFTRASEEKSPEEITEFLNEFFAEMTRVIDHHGGNVDKFMGDAILVVFGAPLPMDNHELAAVSCALEMQTALQNFNDKRADKNLFTLGMGIGLSSGNVMAGNVGSNKRMDYTVIGDAVNTAARIQELAKSGQVLASQSLVQKISEALSIRKIPPIFVRGKKEPLQLVEILGFKQSDFQSSAQP